MRPTRRGVWVAAASGVAALGSWLFGSIELAMVSSGGIAALLAGTVAVLIRPEPQIRRSANPLRVHSGQRCEIGLVVQNPSQRRSGVVEVLDRIDGRGQPRLMIAPIGPTGTVRATYRVPTTRRGIRRVGPMHTLRADPFRMVQRSSTDDSVIGIVVLPTVHELGQLPRSSGDDPERGPHNAVATSTVDEEFAALRDWVPGDDVRRIHWRSTARRGSPVVRQFDVPWQNRTAVVLDLSCPPHDSEHPESAFERAVSAAASAVQLIASRHEQVRLVFTDGFDSGYLSAAENLDELMDRLATVEHLLTGRSAGTDLRRAMVALHTPSGATRVVTCSAQDPDLLAAIVADRRRSGRPGPTTSGSAGVDSGIDIVVSTSSVDPQPARAGATTVMVAFGEGGDLRRAWADAIAAHAPTRPPIGSRR